MDGVWSLLVVSEPVGQADLQAFDCFLEKPDFSMFVVRNFLELVGKILSKRTKNMKIVFKGSESVKRSWEKLRVFIPPNFKFYCS